MMLLNLLFFLGSAVASEGPWTTPAGLHNVYAGLYVEQFRCFEAQGRQSPECASGLPVPSAVRQAGLKIFYRYGLGQKWDVAVAAPLAISGMGDETDNPMHQTTTGVGLLESRVRRRLGSTGLFDWSASAGVRTGALHKETRGRVTNLGEGSTDLVGTISTGSTGLLGAGFYTASIDGSYYYRFPLQVDGDLGGIPGDEIRLSGVFDYALSPRLGVGMSLDGFHRLSGMDLDFAEISKFGDDRWAAIAASQLKVGSRIMLYPKGSLPHLQLSVQRAVWARNNPTDSTFIEMAMGTDFGGGKQ